MIRCGFLTPAVGNFSRFLKYRGGCGGGGLCREALPIYKHPRGGSCFCQSLHISDLWFPRLPRKALLLPLSLPGPIYHRTVGLGVLHPRRGFSAPYAGPKASFWLIPECAPPPPSSTGITAAHDCKLYAWVPGTDGTEIRFTASGFTC